MQRLGNVIRIIEGQIEPQLGELACKTVENDFNKLLDAKADQLCNVTRYERSDTRLENFAGLYQRALLPRPVR
jgi:hypothetical protein